MEAGTPDLMNTIRTAEDLGVSKPTLRKLVKRLGIKPIAFGNCQCFDSAARARLATLIRELYPGRDPVNPRCSRCGGALKRGRGAPRSR